MLVLVDASTVAPEGCDRLARVCALPALPARWTEAEVLRLVRIAVELGMGEIVEGIDKGESS